MTEDGCLIENFTLHLQTLFCHSLTAHFVGTQVESAKEMKQKSTLTAEVTATLPARVIIQMAMSNG